MSSLLAGPYLKVTERKRNAAAVKSAQGVMMCETRKVENGKMCQKINASFR